MIKDTERQGFYKMKRNQTLLGIILTLVGGCFWGLCGACAQYLFENENVTSNFLVPWRMTLAGLLLLTYHLIRSPKTILTPWKSGKDALRLIFYAIFGMAMCQYAYFATIELSNAGTATVLQYSAPAMLLIIVCFMERKLPTGNDILAVICASIGVFLLATHGNFGTLAISPETLGMGLIAALMETDEYKELRDILGLDRFSQVLMFSTEGTTVKLPVSPTRASICCCVCSG